MTGDARGLRLLTLNVGNPSEERVRRQLEWLAGRPEDILLLTETKASAGCKLMIDAFARAGYAVAGALPPSGQYGTLIASKLPLTIDPWAARELYERERASSALVPLADGRCLQVVAVYVPSRDASPEKVERKRRFLEELSREIGARQTAPTALLGDLNVLEPEHRPRYDLFKPFEYDFYRELDEGGMVDAFRLCHPEANEYSWVGRTGDGYRYDHAFVTRDLAGSVRKCTYAHGTRLGADRWTDHSALTLDLDLPVPERLPCDPAALLPHPQLF